MVVATGGEVGVTDNTPHISLVSALLLASPPISGQVYFTSKIYFLKTYKMQEMLFGLYAPPLK